jgi:hypothetical protein
VALAERTFLELGQMELQGTQKLRWDETTGVACQHTSNFGGRDQPVLELHIAMLTGAAADRRHPDNRCSATQLAAVAYRPQVQVAALQ